MLQCVAVCCSVLQSVAVCALHSFLIQTRDSSTILILSCSKWSVLIQKFAEAIITIDDTRVLCIVSQMNDSLVYTSHIQQTPSEAVILSIVINRVIVLSYNTQYTAQEWRNRTLVDHERFDV